jgi:hypothetical protein
MGKFLFPAELLAKPAATKNGSGIADPFLKEIQEKRPSAFLLLNNASSSDF